MPRDLRRVLDPIDPWLEPSGDPSRKEEEFSGTYPEISCFNVGQCPEQRGVVVYYGMRRSIIPTVAGAFAFSEAEVDDAGGSLEDTPATPPWPSDYSDAHRDIVGNTGAVAAHMVTEHAKDPESRISQHSAEALLREMLNIFVGESPLDQSFEKHTRWRIRKIFREDRELWSRLAERFPSIRDDAEVVRALRHEQQEQRKKSKQ